MNQTILTQMRVAPLVGAWIEILTKVDIAFWKRVAPLVGAWIEIPLTGKLRHIHWSLPLWERGLKCIYRPGKDTCKNVAPLVGAWIEILQCP